MSPFSRPVKKKPLKPIQTQESVRDGLHEQAFNNSLQANIIFNVSDGRIIKANKAASKLLGYSQKELSTLARADIFSVSDAGYKKMLRKRQKEGSAKADLAIVRKTGKLRPCEITSSIFKDENGVKTSIMSIVDLRERMLRQKKIDLENEKTVAGNIVIAQSKSDSRQAGNNNWIKSIAKISYDVIWDWNIMSDLICFGNNYEKVFGYKLPKSEISFKEWMAFFKPAERDIVEKKINKIFKSEKNRWEDTYQFTCPDGSVAQVISRAIIIRDPNGKPIRLIGLIHDMSKLQKLELVLREETKIKEKQITEAVAEAKEVERSDIGKELHDNINQLLGASMLYLEMARKDIANGEIYLMHSSEYTLTAIEEIRKLTRSLTTVTIKDFGLCGSIEHVSLDTMEASSVKIHCMLDDSMEEKMNEKFKLNVFRIFQEQLNNILKHAKATDVYISISRKAGLTLSIRDNGLGFEVTQKSDGIGINNIMSRAALYKGKADFISSPGHGCRLVVTFPAGYAFGGDPVPGHKNSGRTGKGK
ncbi:MAG: PAS domain S-box protein [Puia sp.]|nr:PAS domain S-box protein [Puia sp.]